MHMHSIVVVLVVVILDEGAYSQIGGACGGDNYI